MPSCAQAKTQKRAYSAQLLDLLAEEPLSESMASTRRVVGWTGVDVDTSPTHYAEVASDCLWWPAVGADE